MMLQGTRLQISKITQDVFRVVCAHRSSFPLHTPFSQPMYAYQNSNDTIAQRLKRCYMLELNCKFVLFDSKEKAVLGRERSKLQHTVQQTAVLWTSEGEAHEWKAI
jgi:hypothetical protein